MTTDYTAWWTITYTDYLAMVHQRRLGWNLIPALTVIVLGTPQQLTHQSVATPPLTSTFDIV